MFPTLQVLMNSDNPDIIMHTLYTLSYLSDGEDSQIRDIIDLDIVEILFEQLRSDNIDIKIPAMKVVANLLSGQEEDIEYLVKCGVISSLAPFLDHAKQLFRKEACWGFSNLLASTHTHIRRVFSHKEGFVINRLFDMIKTENLEVYLT